MDTMTVVREGGGSEAGPDARRSDRRHMIRAAQIAFGASVLDCALLDTSRGGARVHLFRPAEVPEIATLRLPRGESWTVRRQWQQGAQIGFSVIGTNPPPAIK